MHDQLYTNHEYIYIYIILLRSIYRLTVCDSKVFYLNILKTTTGRSTTRQKKTNKKHMTSTRPARCWFPDRPNHQHQASQALMALLKLTRSTSRGGKVPRKSKALCHCAPCWFLRFRWDFHRKAKPHPGRVF